MSSELKFRGYAIHDTDKPTEFKVIEFEPKRFEEYDVEIAITACGVCGSDVHTITGGWGKPILPMITGHEIVGKAVRVGAKVSSIRVGDRVGVGAQVCSCFECKPCKTDNENYCPNGVDTYNAKYPNGDIAHGGYSTGIRAHERFVFPIPEALTDSEAAPMLCGGLTVYSPLVRNGCGPGKKVGIIGLGGLGHFAVLFAAALGAEVSVISHSADKEADAKKMGAKHFLNTDDKSVYEKHAGEFDLIILTRDVAKDLPLGEYFSLLGVHGRLINVSVPNEPLPAIDAGSMHANGCFLGGSHIGSKKEALEMLKLAAEKGVKPFVREYEMKEAGKAVEAVQRNTVRYRSVLLQDLA